MKKEDYFKIFSYLKSCCQLLLVISLLLGTVQLYAQSDKKVTINVTNKPVREVLTLLKNQSGCKFVYEETLISRTKTVSLSFNETPLKTVIEQMCKQLNINAEFDKDLVLLLPIKPQKQQVAQSKLFSLKGRVIDNTKKPVAGATIIIGDTNSGAISDANGRFSLMVHPDDSITVSFVGMITCTKKVEESNPNFIIEMIFDALVVDDVVVTGYFSRKKETYTGSTTTFTGTELRAISTGNLLSSLSMLDPSFTRVVDNNMGSNPNVIPEFQIRGSSTIKSEYQGNPNMPTFIMDGFEVAASIVFDLDPSRVRSMTILKDAAAAAIYGSRAANGVVVIETIPPSAGALRITYNGSANFEIADLSDYNLMNAKEKLEYEKRAGLFLVVSNIPDQDGLLDIYNQRLKMVEKGYDTDWIKLPVKSLGIGHRHTISLEGGSESFRYGFDVYYSNKEGVMKKSNRDTYGGAIKLQYNYKRLKFSNYSSFDHLKYRNSPSASFSEYTYLNPYYYPYNEDGTISKIFRSYVYYDNGYKTKDILNIFYNTTIPYKNESITNTLINNFSVEYDVISGLKIKAGISLGITDSRSDIYKSRDHTSFMNSSKKGSYSQAFNKGFNYDGNTTINYFKEINKHAINIGAVYNIRETNNDGTSIYVEGFPNPHMDHIGMGIGYIDGSRPSAAYDVTRMIGVVGNLGYTYDNKYLFDASFRSDASSIFGANTRWGTFWSLGIGWNIHKEKFLMNNKIINLLKIRGSMGITGGQNFYSYQALSMYSYSDSQIKDIVYAGYGGAILQAYGNKNLRWQKTDKKNVGIDFEILNRRINGTFNYYLDKSKDLLTDVMLPPSAGFSSYKENLGSVQNSGVELTIRGIIIQNIKNGFKWDVTFNMVHNQNKLMKLNETLISYNKAQDANVKNKPTVRYEEGKSVNTLWANESLGIDPATGNQLFIDINGKLTNSWSSNNNKALGCTDPKIYGTFGTSLFYKGWEANASFFYKTGGDNYNQTLVSKIENVNPNENGDRRILADRWSKTGDVAKYKRISDMTTTYPTSRFIERENYVQLQSLSLAYQFGSKQLEKMGIERCRISAIGNDVFTLSTIRMERGLDYPFARTFSVSVQLTF